MTLRRLVIATLLALAASALVPTSAQAAPACPGSPATTTEVGRVSGQLEALAVDRHGRMFLTDLQNQYVWRIDRPGATPVLLAKGFSSLGGIVVRPDGKLLVGSGNDPINGLFGYLVPSAKLWLVDPETGAKSVFATLRSIDGLTMGPDGSIYASNLFADSIGRISPGGTVELDWARVVNGNGLVVDAANEYLYAVSTLADRPVVRIPIDDPGAVEPYSAFSLSDELNFPDGLTMDGDGNLIVATHLGEIWRIGPDRHACTLVGGLFVSSNVGFGNGAQGFSAGRLFRVGFDGRVLEVVGG